MAELDEAYLSKIGLTNSQMTEGRIDIHFAFRLSPSATWSNPLGGGNLLGESLVSFRGV
ncbi:MULTISPECIES: hypothetical protein [unclassified Nostoc]|uniref:hypothetical protein n=1 Tax=unclassified Nostoc TaxID=2593658 RepID=UPI00261223F7|nr:hypothetical protein [Nostoc sp. S13]MDF5735856.1 hypothetical protein [Nostoc sp. S13]